LPFDLLGLSAAGSFQIGESVMLRHSIFFVFGIIVLLAGSVPFYAMAIAGELGWLDQPNPLGLMLLHFAALSIGFPATMIGIVTTLAERERQP
jgi:hypothetical protein